MHCTAINNCKQSNVIYGRKLSSDLNLNSHHFISCNRGLLRVSSYDISHHFHQITWCFHLSTRTYRHLPTLIFRSILHVANIYVYNTHGHVREQCWKMPVDATDATMITTNSALVFITFNIFFQTLEKDCREKKKNFVYL